MTERDPFEDTPDEPEPSTDDVDAELAGDAEDDQPWFDTEGGSNGA
jgi:hypothetical protein